MFKKVKNRNHVLSQPVRKHIKKHTTQKMVLNHPYRVCLLYTTNKNSHKFMCEVWFKWCHVRYIHEPDLVLFIFLPLCIFLYSFLTLGLLSKILYHDSCQFTIPFSKKVTFPYYHSQNI